MTDEQDLGDIVKSKKFQISAWKLVLSALVIPLINAFGLILKDWLVTSQWDWTIVLIVINAVSIPAVISWLTATFDLQAQKTATEYEVEIKKIKDERDAYKIKAGLSEYALETAKITKPDYDKYINNV